MATMTPFDTSLDGELLIEASAGTGKTYALTTLFARVVVEAGLTVDRPLVVTFTKAAAGELRERVRDTLVDARGAVREGGDDESQGQRLSRRWREMGLAGEAEARLEAAIRDFDRASVMTIHGFCQRMLTEFAFDGALPFAFEVSGDGAPEVALAARDFWRRLADAPVPLLEYALDQGFVPAELAAWVGRLHAKDVVVRGVAADADPERHFEAAQAEWRRAFTVAAPVWHEHGSSFLKLIGSDRIKIKTAHVARVEAVGRALERAFDQDRPEPLSWADSACFARENLARILHKRSWEKLEPDVRDSPLLDCFDDLAAAVAKIDESRLAWLRSQRRRLLDDVRAALHRCGRQDRRLGYNGLLTEMIGALEGPAGEGLALRIRNRYARVLIDEFQDTDGLQARIFERIYAGSETSMGAEQDQFTHPGKTPPRHGISFMPSESPDPGRVRPMPSISPVPGYANDPPSEDHAGLQARAPGGLQPEPDTASIQSAPSPPALHHRPAAGVSASWRAEGGRIIVGDPKQSIYRFRGADIFAYLRASRRLGETTLRLGANYRSTPGLVRAVNALFGRRRHPFLLPQIEFHPAQAAKEEAGALEVRDDDHDPAPFQLRLFDGGADGKPFTKSEFQPIAVDCAAGEIAWLLRLAAAGRATLRGEPVSGGDIAVLVRTAVQGRAIAAALRRRGVQSVEMERESIFATREAADLHRLLDALTTDERSRAAASQLRGALGAELFGLDLTRFGALRDDDRIWAPWEGRAHAWRELWGAKGVAALLRRLLFAPIAGGGADGARHLLAWPDGARRLTNVLHLADLLQQAEAGERLLGEGLVRWLAARRADAGGGDEALLRLESDEELVKIVTIHRSKGLEFPIVFCPFGWDGRKPPGPSDTAEYHDTADEAFPEVLDLAASSQARAAEQVEARSDDLRLLYVALTRAKYRCVMTWARVNFAEHAAAAWLLHGADSGEDDEETGTPADRLRENEAHVKKLGADAWLEEARRVASASEPVSEPAPESVTEPASESSSEPAGDITVTVGPPAPESEQEPETERAPERVGEAACLHSARELGRDLLPTRRMTSYTALSAHGGVGVSAADLDDVEHADHDQREEGAPIGMLDAETRSPVAAGRSDAETESAMAGGPSRAEERGPVAAGVSGAEAGSPADAGPSDADAGSPTAAGPSGTEARSPVVASPSATDAGSLPVASPSGTGLDAFTFPRGRRVGSCLHAILEQCAAEPAADLDRVCASALRRHRIEPKWQPVAHAMVDNARRTPLDETADAFRLVDLRRPIVEMEFHLPIRGPDRVRLGECLARHGYRNPFEAPIAGASPQEDGSAPPDARIDGFLHGYIDLVACHAERWYVIDYKSNWLGGDRSAYAPEALHRAMQHGYQLQYLLYLTALHRHLRVRLPGYDYDRHMGGARYLFLRGMHPAIPGGGVYRDRPARECIEAIDACFAGDRP